MAVHDRGSRRATPTTRLVLACLREGEDEGVEESSGLATRILYDRMARHGYTASLSNLTGVLGALEREGWVERRVKGRKCYAIRLTSKAPHWSAVPVTQTPGGRIVEDYNAPPSIVEVDTEEPLEDPVVDAPAPEPPSSPPSLNGRETPAEEPPAAIGPEVTDVAMELLRLVIERATMALPEDARLPTLERDLADARMKLASATEYANRLRTQRDAATDELVATKEERNSLRTRLRSVEANLDALVKQTGTTATAAYRDGLQHGLDNLIRRVPAARG